MDITKSKQGKVWHWNDWTSVTRSSLLLIQQNGISIDKSTNTTKIPTWIGNEK